MQKNIIIKNQHEFEKIKENFRKDGIDNIHILADFDNTFTNAFVGGERVPSILSILRDDNYLTPDYGQKAYEMYNKYYPYEVDAKISKEEKKIKMNEWWNAHFKLLIESGLNKKDIEMACQSKKIQFREGASELIDFLKEKNIPLVFMSSSGLGVDSISLKLKKEGKLYNNIHIISNSYKWDKNGKAISVKRPIIHGANKDETLIHDFPEIFEIIKNRKNVILIGDSPNDVGMVEGFEYANLLKIGFLNEKTEERLESYKKVYDVIILNDGSKDFINDFFEYIIIS